MWCTLPPQPSSQTQQSNSSTSSTPSRKPQPAQAPKAVAPKAAAPKVRRSVSSRIHEAVKAIALCHNVTPVYESRANGETESTAAEADQDFSDDNRTYQASSPDEVSTNSTELYSLRTPKQNVLQRKTETSVSYWTSTCSPSLFQSIVFRLVATEYNPGFSDVSL